MWSVSLRSVLAKRMHFSSPAWLNVQRIVSTTSILRAEPTFARPSRWFSSTTTPNLAVLNESAKRGDIFAKVELGKHHKNNREYDVALYWLNEAARGGWNNDGAVRAACGEAEELLGTMYLAGLGVQRDLPVAISWLNKSAERGNRDAQGKLGQMYLNGVGIAKDFKLGMYWMEQAALQNHAVAAFHLGTVLRFGLEAEKISRDVKSALRWFLVAAEAGHAGACSSAGQLLLALAAAKEIRGEPVKTEMEQATELLKKAAAGNDAVAQYMLGDLCLSGEFAGKGGPAQDLAEAFFQFNGAAEKGNGMAQCALAFMYFNGVQPSTAKEPCKPDYASAAKWFYPASEAGIPDASFFMGLLFSNSVHFGLLPVPSPTLPLDQLRNELRQHEEHLVKHRERASQYFEQAGTQLSSPSSAFRYSSSDLGDPIVLLRELQCIQKNPSLAMPLLEKFSMDGAHGKNDPAAVPYKYANVRAREGKGKGLRQFHGGLPALFTVLGDARR